MPQESCSIVEIACILKKCGIFYSKLHKDFLVIVSDEKFIINTLFTLLKKTFSINMDVLFRKNSKTNKSSYFILVKSKKDIAKLRAVYEIELEQFSDVCARQFLALTYVMCGSLTDPSKSYHLEFIFNDNNSAFLTSAVLNQLGFKSKVIERKNYFVTYLKDGSNISEFLSLINAFNAVMTFENTRILREIKGNVNRQVNLETANLKKTIDARVKHEEDIQYIFTTYGSGFLKPELMQVAKGRMDYPDSSLNELGEILGLTKSCINHRLRRISKIASKLRGEP